MLKLNFHFECGMCVTRTLAFSHKYAFFLGEEVQLWHDKKSDSEWPGVDDVFLELPNIISGVSECCVLETVGGAT